MIRRWWPPVALVAMVVLGLTVGPRSTALDDWFLRDMPLRPYRTLLVTITDWRVQLVLWLGCLAAVLWQRRWRLLAVVAVTPVLALACVRGLKVLFGRHKGLALAYPSGHTTLLVVLLGLAVIIAGCRLSAVSIAAVATVLGMLGQAMTYHYFTDAVGALLLGSALVGVAAIAGSSPPRHPGFAGPG